MACSIQLSREIDRSARGFTADHDAPVPATNPYRLILEAAQHLNSSRVVLGKSSRASLDKQRQALSRAWQELPEHQTEVSVEILPDRDKAE